MFIGGKVLPALVYELGGKSVCFLGVLPSLGCKANLLFATVGKIFFLFYKSSLFQFFYEGGGGGFVPVYFFGKFPQRQGFLTAETEENVSVAGCQLGKSQRSQLFLQECLALRVDAGNKA